jgi:hypothetical protein
MSAQVVELGLEESNPQSRVQVTVSRLMRITYSVIPKNKPRLRLREASEEGEYPGDRDTQASFHGRNHLNGASCSMCRAVRIAGLLSATKAVGGRLRR